MSRVVEITWGTDIGIDRARQETDQKLDQAIGYLASWAIGSPTYKYVRIYVCDLDYEVSAVYTREPLTPDKEQHRFLMVGIWRKRERKYTFHS